MSSIFHWFSVHFCQWGNDNEGDLTLRVCFIYFTFYKWNNPIISLRCNFLPMDNSKRFWHHYKSIWEN